MASPGITGKVVKPFGKEVGKTTVDHRTAPSLEAPLSPAKKRLRVASLDAAPDSKPRCSNTNESGPSDPLLDQPANPHRKYTPLRTSLGSRLFNSSQESTIRPRMDAGENSQPTTTTANLLEQAYSHLLKMDPGLKPLIEKYPCNVFSAEGLAEEIDPFESLCSGIMSQQVSGAAASSIKKKFLSLFQPVLVGEENQASRKFPQPIEVAAADVQRLRQAGLSQRKAEYIKGLAEKFASGELSAAMLINADDKEVLGTLTAVRGLGKWSVEMFACFGLKRMDILSTGDLGVQYDCSFLKIEGIC